MSNPVWVPAIGSILDAKFFGTKVESLALLEHGFGDGEFLDFSLDF